MCFVLHLVDGVLQQHDPGVHLTLIGPEPLIVGRELHTMKPGRVLIPLVVVKRG